MCPQPRADFYRHIDAVNIDLKAFTEAFYHKLCGGHLQAILDTLLYLKHQTDVWLETTTLLIPGNNDSQEEIDAMTRWVVAELGRDVPMHFTAFHPDWKMLDIPATPVATLARARNIAMDNGVRYAYTGNIVDEQGESTYCHQCGVRAIGRNRYNLTAWNLDNRGCCKNCGTACAGHFESEPGTWGSRFQPVFMAGYAA